jgi:tetratricopeptide (TPR) repeat protein
MAFSQYKAAAKMDPDNAAVYLAWGNALLREGKRDEAVQLYQSALQRNPKLAAVHYQLALEFLREQKAALVAQKQDVKENHAAAAARSGAEAQMAGANAARHFAAAAAAGFSTAEFWQSYGILLNRQGNYHEAEICLTKAEALQPGSAETELQWASADYHQNKDAGAIDHFGLALSLAPNDPAALNGLALLYATARDAEIRSPKMAILLATRACDGTNADNPQFLDTLARAYAADGDFFQAIAAEDHAVRRAAEAGDHRLLREIQPRFALFVQHKPE